jgi:hypothetical protein
MSKVNLLSSELSRNRALAAGGAQASDILVALRRWAAEAPTRGTRKTPTPIFRWQRNLTDSISDTLALGAPIGPLLREAHPMVRREERQCAKLQALERQFGFQGAIALVLPWAVAALTGGVRATVPTFAGAFCQLLGLVAFYFMIRHALHGKGKKDAERQWLFEFLVSLWMRTLAGMALQQCLGATLDKMPLSEFRTAWSGWLAARASACSYVWKSKDSERLAALIEPLLTNGAPASEVLSHIISQIDDDRQMELEERIAALPTKLSLVFCGLLTPAVFLVLLGALWPILSTFLV